MCLPSSGHVLFNSFSYLQQRAYFITVSDPFKTFSGFSSVIESHAGSFTWHSKLPWRDSSLPLWTHFLSPFTSRWNQLLGSSFALGFPIGWDWSPLLTENTFLLSCFLPLILLPLFLFSRYIWSVHTFHKNPHLRVFLRELSLKYNLIHPRKSLPSPPPDFPPASSALMSSHNHV